MARLRPQVRIPLGEEIISAKELICYGPYSAIDYDMAPLKWLPEKQVMSPYDHVQICHTIVPKIGTMQFVYNSTIYLSTHRLQPIQRGGSYLHLEAPGVSRWRKKWSELKGELYSVFVLGANFGQVLRKLLTGREN